jgi:hypothetical protein
MFDTLKRGALAAAAALAIAGCGGGSDNPPSETDLLNGAGKFENADAQGQWHVNAPEGATLNEDLFAPCPEIAGLTGTCAKINSSDFGANTYSTQLILWDTVADPAAPMNLHLRADKQYTVKFTGAVESNDLSSRPVSIWLQECTTATDCNWPPANGNPTIELPTDGLPYVSDPFSPGADMDVHLVINMGPDSTNAETTFFIDNLQIIEEPKAPPPGGADLLAGAGSFETNPAESWYKNINSALDANLVTLEFSACPAGGTGTCAVFSSTDPNGFGLTTWHSQLIYGLTGTPTAVDLDPTKHYRIGLKGMVQGCTAPVTIVSWLQPNTTPNWPPANNNNWNLVFTGTMADVTTTVFPGADGAEFGFVLNFSFGNATTGNVGCAFTLDDVQLIQVD